MMGLFVKIMAVLVASQLSWAAGADGIPRPWPFPWAKSCPMSWSDLAGRYKMVGSTSREQILVRVSADNREDLVTIRLVRVTSAGNIRAIGLAMVYANENEVKVHMVPVREKYGASWVTLRMHYNSKVLSCQQAALVPILTVSPDLPSGNAPEEQYPLSKAD
jgi:hypothetical protein